MKAFRFNHQYTQKGNQKKSKYSKKPSKALKKYSLYLLFSLLTGLFLAFSNTAIEQSTKLYMIKSI